MVASRIIGSVRALTWTVAIALGGLLLTGCVTGWGATRAPEPEIEPRIATRAELLRGLQARTNGLATLQARSVMKITGQKIFVLPANADDERMLANTSYVATLWERQADGQIILSRDAKGSVRLRLFGSAGSDAPFSLLAQDGDFWMDGSAFGHAEKGAKATDHYIYYGKADRSLIRPQGALSVRPQDISDLLLFDEANVANPFCYMETWQNFYILTFLRQDWPQHIHSRIWVDRTNLQPASHQIYDVSGELVAEARFKDYRSFPAADSAQSLPTQVTFLWPRDMLVVEMTMKPDSVAVNRTLDEKWLKPPETQADLPFGYALRELRSEAPEKSAVRAELLLDLQTRMSRLATLQARAVMNVSRQDILVPATVRDDLRRIAGKAYHKKFWRNEVNGYVRLERDPRGSRNVSFTGDVSGLDFSFKLLGRDAEFWMAWPNIERDRHDDSTPAGYVYHGTANRALTRSKEAWSMRPQDVCDLLLFDESFDARMIPFVETWPRFYILTFLREDWPEHICSKVWFDRSNMEPAVHQIYDGSGELVAEARFKGYKDFGATRSQVKASLPTAVTLLWPRDMLLMSMMFDSVLVNETIDDRWFKPYRTAADLPVGYELRELRVEDVPRGRAPR